VLEAAKPADPGVTTTPTQPGTGGTGSTPGTKPGGTPTAPTAPTVTVPAVKAGKLAAVLAKGLSVSIAAPAGTALTAQLVLDAKTAKRLHLGKKAVVLGTATAVATASGGAKVVVKLSAKARRALKRQR